MNILERKTILQRVGDKIQDFINTFIEGMEVMLLIVREIKS